MEGYIGEVRMFGADYAPENWMACQGQELEINGFAQLFSVISNIFGGDGRSTFKLPDLRGRVPWGALPNGGTAWTIGGMIGYEKDAIPIGTIWPHNHQATLTPAEYTASAVQKCYKGFGAGNTDPENRYFGPSPSAAPIYYNSGNADMGDVDAEITKADDYQVTVESAGGGQKIPLVQPSLCVNFIICVEGHYPPRS